MRFCFILAGILLTANILAGGADTLQLPEGATKPGSISQVRLHETQAQDLALLPPHRLDDTLPKENLRKQPLFAKFIKVDKSFMKRGVLQDRLKKLGYYMNTMKSNENPETGEKTYQSFLLKELECENKEAPKEDITVKLHWVSKTKALIMITNAKDEFVALKDYKAFIKPFQQKKAKKSRAK